MLSTSPDQKNLQHSSSTSSSPSSGSWDSLYASISSEIGIFITYFMCCTQPMLSKKRSKNFFSHIIFIYDLRHKSCFYDSLVLNWSDRIYKNRYLMVSFGSYLYYCKQYKCRQFSFSHSERTSHAEKLYVLIRNKGIPVLFLTHTETSLNYYWLVQDYSHL